MAHYKVIFWPAINIKSDLATNDVFGKRLMMNFVKMTKECLLYFLTQKDHKCRTYFEVSQICTAENMLQ